MLVAHRDWLETQVRRAVKRVLKKHMQADHNRQPPYATIRKALIKELDPILNKITGNVARDEVRRFGTASDRSWRPEPNNRAELLADDLIQVSKRRWSEMKKPRKRAEVLKWRKQNLGDSRAISIAATEVTLAINRGKSAAFGYLGSRGVLMERIWRTRRDQCELCRPMKNQPSAVWSRFYPMGPPSPHVRCRCELEQIPMAVYQMAQAAIRDR